MTQKMTLDEINDLGKEAFIQALGGLFEGRPWIVARAWSRRPFASVETFHRTLCSIMDEASIGQQVALLSAHPDLVGRAALAGTLSPASTGEQAAAGLDRLTPEEIALFQDYNREYRARFGFPFVICARENKKESILAGFATRLTHTYDQEIRLALAEVAKICALRLYDLVEDTSAQAWSYSLPRRARMDTNYTCSISYGKLHIPVYRVYARPLEGVSPIPESRFTGRANTLLALQVDVEVFGDNFLPAYVEGDNSNVVATDSMKNFVLRQTLTFAGSTHEELLAFLGERFLTTYAQMQSLRLTVRELPFTPVSLPDETTGSSQESAVLFSRSHNDFTRASMTFARDEQQRPVLTEHRCSRVGLELFKVTGSAFTHFVQDEYTTLPQREDRPLFIRLDVSWTYTDHALLTATDHARYVPAEQVRDLLHVVFDEFVSESIQHLVYTFGCRLLDRFPQLASVTFDAQNHTRDLIAEAEDGGKEKVYSDPFNAFGSIHLTMARAQEG